MEHESKKCSQKKHSEINAIAYCVECKRYLCNKCKNNHSELFEDHQLYDLNKNIKELFTGYCTENNHNIPLEYFCKSHNILCCAACVTKIKGEGKGQHSTCDVCLLKEIKEEKISKLKENINLLEQLNNNLGKSFNNLNKLFIDINQSKEELKVKIQNIFTKIRSAINEREEQLLLEVDKEYNKYFINEEFISKNEKIPQKLKSVLEKGKNIDKENKNNNNNIKLNALINDCINIENNVKELNKINELIEKFNDNKNLEIIFIPFDNGINQFIQTIKIFGEITDNDIKIDSKIISKKDYNLIQDWLKESIGEINNYQLIYRATEQGDSNSITFQICKYNQNLLWIMKNKNNSIFGCFNSIQINSNNFYSKDSKCFLFSLSRKKKYNPNLQIANNIYNCNSHLLEFGDGNVFELCVGDKFLSTNSVTFKNGPIFNHKNEISDNNTSIILSELEVFRIS